MIKETYELPNGKIVEKEKVIKNNNKNSVIVIALDKDNNYILNFQQRDYMCVNAPLVTEINAIRFWFGLIIGPTPYQSSPNVKDKFESSSSDTRLEIGDFELKLSTEKGKINMEPLMNEIAEQSYNLFKVEQEPYNIEEIKLVPKYEDENNDFTFDEIVLDSYDGKRGEYSPSNTQTNGILNKFKFGTKKLFKKLSKTSVKFDLTFETKP